MQQLQEKERQVNESEPTAAVPGLYNDTYRAVDHAGNRTVSSFLFVNLVKTLIKIYTSSYCRILLNMLCMKYWYIVICIMSRVEF